MTRSEKLPYYFQPHFGAAFSLPRGVIEVRKIRFPPTDRLRLKTAFPLDVRK